jgi:hypothetical protein
VLAIEFISSSSLASINLRHGKKQTQQQDAFNARSRLTVVVGTAAKPTKPSQDVPSLARTLYGSDSPSSLKTVG